MGDPDDSTNENEEYFDEKIKLMIIGETRTGKTKVDLTYQQQELISK